MIRSLRLKGFKSFADETEIRFTEGINCIVGPNGCGKSNIVDALKWIVGVTSAKGMRADSIRDLVFKGTESRRPLRSAEVSVVVSPRDLTVPETEVTRRIKSDGESEFLINGKRVRLKDIQELFSKLGISNRDYAFFEQGQIDRVLRMKPSERKALIDEAAGITPFKERREETLRQLEEAEQNLESTRGIIDEVAKNLRVLKSQAEKAKKFKELREKEKRLELSLYGFKLKRVQEEKSKLEGILKVFQEDRASLERERALLEVEIEDRRRELEELNREVEGTRSELYEVEKSKKEASVKGEFLKKEIERLEGEIEKKREEIEKKLSKISILKDEIEELSSKERELVKKLSILEKREREIKGNLDKLKAERERLEEIEISTSRKISSINSQVSKLQLDLAREEERFKSQSALLRRIPLEKQELEKERKYYTFQIDRIEEKIEDLKSEISQIEEKLSEKKSELRDEEERFEDFKEELEEKRRELLKLNTEIENTERIVSSMNLKKVEQKIVESGREGKVKGFLGLLLNFLEVEPGWERLVENYVRQFGAGIVLECAGDVVWVKDRIRGRGRVNLLFSSVPEVPDSPEIEGALPVEKFLKVKDSKVKNLVKALFHKVYYSPEAAPKLAEKYPDSVFIDGDFNVFSAKGCVVGKGSEFSFLELERELKSKRELVRKIAEELEELSNRRSDYATEIERVREIIDDLKGELQKRRMELFESESKLKEMRNRLREVERRESELLEKEERAKESIGSFERRKKVFEDKISKLNEEKTSLIAKLGELKRKREEVEGEYDRLREELSKERSESSVLIEKLSSLREKLKSKEGFLRNLQREISNLEKSLERDREEFKRAKEELLKAEELLSGVDEAITDIKEELRRLEEKRGELLEILGNKERALKQRQRDLSEVSRKLKEAEVKLAKLTVQEEELLSKIVEIDGSVSEALELSEGVESEEELRRELTNLKEKISRMGAVNMLAVEEYEKIKERYGFILQQEKDLIESIKNLKEALKKLDEEIEKKFFETYKKLNKHFRETVERVFNGGKGRLILTSEKLSEAGLEIEVKPPGKRHANINLLSGGERTLVAIAFLYSLYSVRPAPFVVLDEVDAALDDVNTLRFTELLKQMAEETQVIVVTHNKLTMEAADSIYGITMEVPGISKVIGVSFEAIST